MITESEPKQEAGHPELHEEREVLPRILILRVVWISICLTVILCIVAYLLTLAWRQQFGPVLLVGEQAPHEVSNVRQETFRTAFPHPSAAVLQQRQLEGYQWVNQERGLVAIPIDRAMEIVASQGGKGRAAP